MNKQLSLFDCIIGNDVFKEGNYVENLHLGKELTFDEIVDLLDNLIVIDCSTESHNWYKVVKIEKIVTVENNVRRLVYNDGKKQRGLVNEYYFNKQYNFPARAWLLI